MANTVSSFKRLNFASGIGNVAAANEFYANVTLPSALQALIPDADRFRKKISFGIQAANIPDQTVGLVEVPFRSTKIKLPGDRDTSGTWDVTIRADLDGVVRSVFESWNDALNGNVNHDVIGDYDLDITALFGVGEVHQLSRNDKIMKSWSFDSIFPQTVGAISYDWSSENTVIQFPVTFAYWHMESNSTRGNTINGSAETAGDILI